MSDVRVYVRCSAPATPYVSSWECDDSNIFEKTRQLGKKAYTMDRCFGTEVTNSVVFDTAVKDVVLKAMEGRNCTIFAHGHERSGKSVMMKGDNSDSGVMKSSFEIISRCIEKQGEKVRVKVSYFEV